MPIHWDARNKRWRFSFNSRIKGVRYRSSKLLPAGWTKAQADAYDRKEGARLWAVASGTEKPDGLIDDAVLLYLQDKQHLKSLKPAEQHLNEIAWAYTGRPMSALADVAREIAAAREGSSGVALSDATIRNRLALLKAACRWAWKRHGMGDSDPAARMVLPVVRNERHAYLTRQQMLLACRACTNWDAQVAIRVAFYTGMRLGELLRVQVDGGLLILSDTKNGDRRAIPAHPKIKHLLSRLPLPGPKITIQRAWERARDAVGLQGYHFHDLRHSAASEMVNAGVDLYVVGKVLGHRDVRSTKRYAHLTTEALSAAVNRIGLAK